MRDTSRWIGYLSAAAAAAACTLIGFAMAPRFDIVNIAMVYLLAVVIVALRFTRGPAILSAVLCVAAFDFAFVPPQGTFTVNDAQYLVTFAIILAIAIVIADLMERGRRDAGERTTLAIAAETEHIRSTLLASISHDLRTPIAVVVGASSTLAESGERLDPVERSALARSLYNQARDLSAQVDKVLQMTRLESGSMTLERDWAAIPEIAASVLDRLSERLSGHRLLIDFADDLPLVRVDAGLIDQALANLLENAARYTPPGTIVRLRAKCEDRKVVVSVEDFGAGLEGKDLERVFAKFQRSAAEGPGGGVGLGLSICRAIVRLHGGQAWAERIPGGGTAFRFSLPVEEAPRPPADADSA